MTKSPSIVPITLTPKMKKLTPGRVVSIRPPRKSAPRVRAIVVDAAQNYGWCRANPHDPQVEIHRYQPKGAYPRHWLATYGAAMGLERYRTEPICVLVKVLLDVHPMTGEEFWQTTPMSLAKVSTAPGEATYTDLRQHEAGNARKYAAEAQTEVEAIVRVLARVTGVRDVDEALKAITHRYGGEPTRAWGSITLTLEQGRAIMNALPRELVADVLLETPRK